MSNFRLDKREIVFIGEKPKTEEEAWAISFEKWETLAEHPGSDDNGFITCGLCMLYYPHCKECPVGLHNWGCMDTPYEDYVDNPSRENAEAELAFLKEVYNAGK